MRKCELIIGLAQAGLSASEIAERLDTTVNSVKVVCSRARSEGVDIPYERDRRAKLRAGAVVTLSERQVESIVSQTGLTPQQFVEQMLGILPGSKPDALLHVDSGRS